MEQDRLYCEPFCHGYTSWTYSDGQRVIIHNRASLDKIERYAKRHRFKLIVLA